MPYFYPHISISYIYKKFADKDSSYLRKSICFFIGAILGVFCCLFLGTFWFSVVSKMNFFSALKICVYPFIFGDIFKILIVWIVVLRVEKVFNI